ncbi:MAG: NTP transferase domain-containing protein [Oceanibaculum sp.]
MIFAERPLAECRGALLAHSQRVGDDMLRKGRLLDDADIRHLAAAGVTHLTVAQLEAGDVREDEAAQSIAALLPAAEHALASDPAFTGRVNLRATADGVLDLDVDTINALNAVDEAITIATLPRFAAVRAGQMVATIKIIPYAVARDVLARAIAVVSGSGRPLLRVHPYRPQRIALIQTELGSLKPGILAKTELVMTGRLAAMGQSAPAHRRCPHQVVPLQETISDALASGAEMVLLVGASAISDRRDVIPAAITALGGEIEQFGMPVDPGNLLLLARLGRVPVLGLPGCVRTPKLNGCDWVMQRLLAGLPVTGGDIRAMGIGGLLAEIPSRPQPREGRAPSGRAKIAALVLAAGRSSRMGRNKLLLDLEGRPILAHVVAEAAAAGIADIIVVTGHQAGKVKAALADARVRTVEARDHATGMAASLKAGLKALPADADAVLVLLGDMPQVSADLIRAIIAAYNPLEGRAIVLPVADGKRGNPALFDRRFFPEMLALEGDIGARQIIAANGEAVAEVPADPGQIFVDVDTPEAYRAMLAARAARGAGAA